MADIIGGEFAIDPFTYKNMGEIDIPCYASGRTSLYVILNDIRHEIISEGVMCDSEIENKSGLKILLPYYLCSTITNTVKDAGWQFFFYELNEDLTPKIESYANMPVNMDAIVLINYFGMTALNDSIQEIKRIDNGIRIIVDNVQALFSKGCLKDIDYEFNSYRKWLACTDGSYAIKYKPERQYVVENNILNDKRLFQKYKYAGNILKNFTEYVNEEIILDFLSEGEDILDNYYKCKADSDSVARLNSIDYEAIRIRRISNASILHEGLVGLGINHIYKSDVVPLFVPIFVSNRNELRKHFFDSNIYTPIHWPKGDMGECLVEDNEYLYNTELSLICDQRYNEKQMIRQLQVLEEFCKNGMSVNG